MQVWQLLLHLCLAVRPSLVLTASVGSGLCGLAGGGDLLEALSALAKLLTADVTAYRPHIPDFSWKNGQKMEENQDT